MSVEALAGDFEPLAEADWRKLAESALKGADFDKMLVSSTHDGIQIDPVYARSQGAKPKTARGAVPWSIIQRIDHPDTAMANAQALVDLENGASGLTLVFAGASSARGYGLTNVSLAEMKRLMEGVYADQIHLRVEAGASGFEAAGLAMALADERGFDATKLDWSLGIDPVGSMLASGDPGDGIAPALTRLGDAAIALTEKRFAGRVALADGRPWHEAGASEAQELAAMLATALLYLRTFEKAGLDLEKSWSLIGFATALDSDQFSGLAKLRVLNDVWRRIGQKSGIMEPTVPHIHGETDWRSQTRYDPYVNMLRATMGTFVGAVGGAASISVLPFTATIGLPDEFARRVARNTQLVLMEESNLARVSDPLAGSGYGETLTKVLAEKTWTLFQKIEAGGGIAAALDDGLLQEDILAVAEARAKNMSDGTEILTGTTSFPNLTETIPETLEAEPVSGRLSTRTLNLPEGGDGARFKSLLASIASGSALDLIDQDQGEGAFTPLPSLRLAEPFEALRDRAKAISENGKPPSVFIAGLGPLAGFAARANWIENLFAMAGLEAETVPELDAPKAAGKAFEGSDAKVACLCGPDALYDEPGLDVAVGLRSAGAQLVCLAGRPGELAETMVQSGVSVFLHVGCDILASLDQVLSQYES